MLKTGTRLESRYPDCDRMGIVHHAVFPLWYEVARMEWLTAAGIPVSVISTLRADNAPLLPELYETLLKYPIFAWQIQACSPMGNAGRNRVDVRFDVRETIAFIAAHAHAQPFYICAADSIGYYAPEEPDIRGPFSDGYKGCAAGIASIGIDSIGNVRGCESMTDACFIEGNLRKQSLAGIWMAPGAFAYNRSFTPAMLTGACAGCPHGDLCAGGCRAYNWFMHGRLHEAPACARQNKNISPVKTEDKHETAAFEI